MELVALLSTGTGTWGQVSGVINSEKWNKIILVGNEFAKTKFSSQKKFEFVKVDFNKPVKELIDEIVEKLRGKLAGMEVALSIASGTGKEHMTLISSLIKVPVGIKFVALTKDGLVLF